MEKTYIIKHSSDDNWVSQLQKENKFETIEYIGDCDDVTIDKFIKEKLPKDFDRLIVPTDIGKISNGGINLLAHIRLSASILGNKVLAPIIMVGPEPIESLLKREPNTNQIYRLLLSPGTKYCNDIVEISLHHKNLQAVKPSKFLSDVYSKIHIENPKGDNHSLANLWGAYVFDRCAKTEYLGDFQNIEQKKLYFKWLEAKKYDYSSLEKSNLKQEQSPTQRASTPKLKGLTIADNINNKKNILYIDDKADEYWGKLLKKWDNKKNNFEFISKVGDTFEDYIKAIQKKIEEKSWHLIYLDLRLNPEKDKSNISDLEYSGIEILRFIKRHNRGTQVIIFTASNKAWNLKKMLVDGVQNTDEFKITADGYYIKESPLFNLGDDFSQKNYIVFKNETKAALDKSYLVKLWRKLSLLKNDIEQKTKEINDNQNEKSKMYLAMGKHLEQAFEMLILADKNYYNYSFLSFFMFFEELANYYKNFIFDTSDVLFKWDSTLSTYEPINFDNKAPISQIIPTIFIDKWFTDDSSLSYELAQKFSSYNSKRNKIMHKGKDVDQESCENIFNFIFFDLKAKFLSV